MGEKRNSEGTLVAKNERKYPRRKWVDNIKLDLKDI
jgi:hypothetical protein